MKADERTALRTPAQTFALVLGVVHVLLGLLAVTVIHLHVVHNVLHFVLAGAWLGGALAQEWARPVNLALGSLYVVVGVAGFAGWLESISVEAGIGPENVLHLLGGGVSLYFGSAGASSPKVRSAAEGG